MEKYKYRVAITALNENNVIYERITNILKEEDVTKFLSDNINSRELFPSSILKDAKENGSAVCWCGSNGYGYDVKQLIHNGTRLYIPKTQKTVKSTRG